MRSRNRAISGSTWLKTSNCGRAQSQVPKSTRCVEKYRLTPAIPEEDEHLIAPVDRNVAPEIGSITKISGQWERIPIKTDSGAIDTVMPPSVGLHVELVEAEMSQRGPGFRAANGSPIKRYGQRVVR